MDLPDHWVAIAYQGLNTTPGGFHHLYWKPLPGAPIDYADAREMIRQGLLISAQRRPFAGAGMELLVKRSTTQPASPSPKDRAGTFRRALLKG